MSAYKGFKVGDIVRIERKGVDHDPNGMGAGVRWGNSWTGEMTKHIGKTYAISHIHLSGADLEGVGYGWPLNVLTNLSPALGVDDNGASITVAHADIMDFMRVVVDGKPYIVFTNARLAGLPKYITNGVDKPVKLELSNVEAVYSQPSSDVLCASRLGKLRFKRVDTAKLLALQAAVDKAEVTLAAAKIALAESK